MDRTLIEQEVARVLMGMGVRVERLRPDARLLHDLRIEGDDAADFFDAVAARFGTDLTALRADWDAYFGPESLSIAAGAAGAIGSAVAAAAAALAGVPVVLCVVPAAMGGAAAWLVGRRTGTRTGARTGATIGTGRPRPIRLSEVVDAVERGRWEGTATTRRAGKG